MATSFRSLFLLGLLLAGAPSVLRGQTAGPAPPVESVLFMCPHGAAKSVLASAYFRRLAEERGLKVRVVSRGTDPDPRVAPVVAAHLEKQGHTVPAEAPRRASADDLAAADVVVSLGCDLSGLPAPRGRLVRWDDVPPPDKDFAAADAAIKAHVAAFVDELAAAARARTRSTP